MHRTTKRLASAVLAAALCCAAALPAGADYEPWTYEVDDLMGSYGVEYYSDVGFDLPQSSQPAAKSSSGGVSTQSAVTQPASGGRAVVVGGESDGTAEYASNDISVYVDGGEITYTGTGYTVTVPAEVPVDNTENKGTLSITATLEQCSELEVAIASANNWKLKCGSWEFPYTLDSTEKKVVFDSTATKSVGISVNENDVPVVSGDYTDQLTFTMTPTYPQYTLTFDTNAENTSETASDYDTYHYDEVTISKTEMTVEGGHAYGKLPTPERVGYGFDGWYTAKTGGKKVENQTIATENATLYAHWTAHKLIIRYHNGIAEKILWQTALGTVGKFTTDPDYACSDSQGYTRNDDYLVLDTTSYGDVTLLQIEEYGKKWSNNTAGIFDLIRWKKGSYSGAGNHWARSEKGTGKISDQKKYVSAAELAVDVSLLDKLQQGDVELDLYPVWPAGVQSIDELETEEPVVLLPEVDEKTKPVVIDMPAVDTTGTDGKQDTETTGKKDTETTTDTVSDEPETTPKKPDTGTTPDDLMISEVDEMIAAFNTYEVPDLDPVN